MHRLPKEDTWVIMTITSTWYYFLKYCCLAISMRLQKFRFPAIYTLWNLIGPIFRNDLNGWMTMAGALLSSFAAGVVMHLLVEVPFGNIQKVSLLRVCSKVEIYSLVILSPDDCLIVLTSFYIFSLSVVDSFCSLMSMQYDFSFFFSCVCPDDKIILQKFRELFRAKREEIDKQPQVFRLPNTWTGKIPFKRLFSKPRWNLITSWATRNSRKEPFQDTMINFGLCVENFYLIG